MATRPYTGPSARPGISVLGLLGIIFVTLKLAGIGAVAAWSWWWVLAPFWGPFALLLAIAALGLIVWAGAKGGELAFNAWDRRKEAKSDVPATSPKR